MRYQDRLDLLDRLVKQNWDRPLTCSQLSDKNLEQDKTLSLRTIARKSFVMLTKLWLPNDALKAMCFLFFTVTSYATVPCQFDGQYRYSDCLITSRSAEEMCVLYF